MATLEGFGTGALLSHSFLELGKSYRVFIGAVDAGRLVRYEFESDAAFEEGNKVFDREADLLSGIIPSEKSE